MTTMARPWIVAVAMVLTAACVPASNSDETATPGPSLDHAVWDALVRQYVDDAGRVAYLDLQTEAADRFGGYLDALATAAPDAWPLPEQLAFWINAYNAGTVLAVTEGSSAESLLGRGKLFKFWKFDVAGKSRSLDEIEHDILRKRFTEPRIHFAIVCASASCPVLRQEAFVAAALDNQLDDQARRFINDPMRNQFDRDRGEIGLSKIFDWFRGDFERDASLLETISRFVASPETAAWLVAVGRGQAEAKIEHLDYDWTLNAQPEQRPSRKHRSAVRKSD